jgi:hypothetical protein
MARHYVTASGQQTSLVDHAQLENPDEWLNRDCVSTLATFLSYSLTDPLSCVPHFVKMCGVFNSQAFTYAINSPYNDHGLHNWCKGAKYWKHPVWIVPIHRLNHWVVAIVSHYDKQIYMYDSFGFRHKLGWKREIKVCNLCHSFYFVHLTWNHCQVICQMIVQLDKIAREGGSVTLASKGVYEAVPLMVSLSIIYVHLSAY